MITCTVCNDPNVVEGYSRCLKHATQFELELLKRSYDRRELLKNMTLEQIEDIQSKRGTWDFKCPICENYSTDHDYHCELHFN